MLAEIEAKLTSQTVVWQFRLSKAGRLLRGLEASTVCVIAKRHDQEAKPKNASCGDGRARQDLKSGGREGRAAHEVHGPSTRRILLIRMLLRKPRASLADPAGGFYRHRPMSGWAAPVRPPLPLGRFCLGHMSCNRIHQRRRQAIIGLEPEFLQARANPVHLIRLDA